jgi:hypothetical protein
MVAEAASIGRATDNDIVLNDFSVSRKHAFLKKEDGDWVIYDNGSTNGVRSTTRRCLGRGQGRDQVLIGTFVLRFRDDPNASREGDRLIDLTSTCIRPIAELNQDFSSSAARRSPGVHRGPAGVVRTSPTRTRFSRSWCRSPRR